MVKRSGMLLKDEEKALRELVRSLLPTPIIIDIGTGLGCSAAAMLDARPGSVIFTIDVDVADAMLRRVEEMKLDARRVMRLLGRSQDILKHWPDASADVVYVDGSHELTDAMEDIELAKRIVKPDGIIILHDHSPPKPRNETDRQLRHEAWVTEAAQKLLGEYEVVAHVNRLKAFRR